MNPDFDYNFVAPGNDNDGELQLPSVFETENSKKFSGKSNEIDVETTNQILMQELAKERQRVSTLEGIILSMFLSPGTTADVKAKEMEVNSSIPLLLHGKEELLNSTLPPKTITLDLLNPRCPPELRKQKIEKYKAKLKRRRFMVHLNRSYSGRSCVAKAKPRVNGKFARS